MLKFGLWAAGSLAIGLGVVPVVAGLASIVRPHGESGAPGVEALAIVTVLGRRLRLLHGGQGRLSLDRLRGPDARAQPHLPRPAALRRDSSVLRAARRPEVGDPRSGCFRLYLVRATPYRRRSTRTTRPTGWRSSALANRIFRWPAETIEHALTTVTIVATVVLALVPRVRSRRVAHVLVVGLAVATLAWTGTAEVYAAHGENLFSARLYASLPKPANWLDRSTQGRSVVFLGQSVNDPNPMNLLEFWNRSLEKVWSLDGTAPGPGTTVTPNVDNPDGTLTNPHTDFALVTPGVDIAGQPVGKPVGGYSCAARQTVATPHRPDGGRSGWMDGAGLELLAVRRPPGTRARPGRPHAVLVRQARRSTVLIRLGPIADSSTGSRRSSPSRVEPTRHPLKPGEVVRSSDPTLTLARRGVDRSDVLTRRARPKKVRPAPTRCRRHLLVPSPLRHTDERLRVLAREPGHPARVPERVPREELPVDHRGVGVRDDGRRDVPPLPARPASRGSRGRCPRRSGGSRHPSRRSPRASSAAGAGTRPSIQSASTGSVGRSSSR